MTGCALLKAHCAHCPIRQMGMAHPQSMFARIHRWHSAWWPAWKALQADRRTQVSITKARLATTESG